MLVIPEFLKKHSKGLSVLYVEDDDSLRASTTELLKNFFNSIDAAEDGSVGLEKYKTKKYDLVITDIRMPRMDGIKMSNEIRKINKSQTIIVISAHDESDYLITLLNIGVDKFVLKPIDLTMFLDVLESACKNLIFEKMLTEYQHKIEKATFQLRRKTEELEKKNEELLNKIEQLKTEENKTIALIEAVTEERKISKEEINLLAKVYEKVSALEFVSSYPTDLLLQSDKLEAIEEKLDIGINRLTESCNLKDVKNISGLFRIQGNIIDTIPEFSNLAYGLTNLADAIENLKNEDIKRLVMHKDILFTIAESMFNWRETIFVKKDAQSIHYLDNALISDCIQVEALLSGKQIEGEELELF